MRLLVAYVIFIGSLNFTFAQIKVTYDVEVNLSNAQPGVEQSEIVKKSKRYFAQCAGTLIVCDKRSYFKAENIAVRQNQTFNSILDLNHYLTTADSITKVSESQQKLIYTLANKTEWAIDYKSKQNIIGYECIKATKTVKVQNDERTITVWFTPDLQYSSGMIEAAGLPGLILRYESMLIFTATKIISLTDCEIKLPSYDLVRRSEYNSFNRYKR